MCWVYVCVCIDDHSGDPGCIRYTNMLQACLHVEDIKPSIGFYHCRNIPLAAPIIRFNATKFSNWKTNPKPQRPPQARTYLLCQAWPILGVAPPENRMAMCFGVQWSIVVIIGLFWGKFYMVLCLGTFWAVVGWRWCKYPNWARPTRTNWSLDRRWPQRRHMLQSPSCRSKSSPLFHMCSVSSTACIEHRRPRPAPSGDWRRKLFRSPGKQVPRDKREVGSEIIQLLWGRLLLQLLLYAGSCTFPPRTRWTAYDVLFLYIQGFEGAGQLLGLATTRVRQLHPTFKLLLMRQGSWSRYILSHTILSIA